MRTNAGIVKKVQRTRKILQKTPIPKRRLAKTESQSSPQIDELTVSSEEVVLGAIFLDRTRFACSKRASSYSNEEWPQYRA